MATNHSEKTWSQDYFYIRNYGDSNDRYRFYFSGKLNSVNYVNKTANITIEFTAGANWAGYGQYWSLSQDIFIQKGDTVLNSQTRYWVSTVGTGTSSNSSSTYVNNVITHTSAGSSTGATTFNNGKFFTWTGDVAYDLDNTTSPTVGLLRIDLYHAYNSGNFASYLPKTTAKTKRATWIVPAIIKTTFNANGGAVSPSETWSIYEDNIPLPTPTRNNSGVHNGGSAIVTSYNANGGTTTPSNQTSYAQYKTVYGFNGWYTDSSSGTQVGGGGSSYAPTAPATLYAHWDSTENFQNYGSITTASAISRNNSSNHNGGSAITTSYNANGGTSTPAAQTNYRQYQTKYTFEKWHVGSAAGTTSVAANGSYAPSANNTLYANWTTSEVAQNSYSSITLAGAIVRNTGTSSESTTVTFSANGGTCSTASLTSSRTKTTAYTFNGWHVGSATGTTYEAGGSYAPSANTTLYAGWDTSTTYGQYSQITLPTPDAPANKAFDGWYTASTGGTYVGTAGGKYTPTAGTTLYAHYMTMSVAEPEALGIYIKTADGWKEIKDFARVKTASTTWKTYVD